MFITFEGIDGSGKTTFINIINKHLSQKYNIITTKEPGGGGNFSMQIRNIIISNKVSQMTDLFAIYAARNEHIKNLIIPNIKQKNIVICDRFTDSSIAYLSIEYGFEKSLEIVKKMNTMLEHNISPDLTILLSIKESNQFIKHRNNLDRYDSLNKNDKNIIIESFKKLKLLYPDRIIEIQNNSDIKTISELIIETIEQKIFNHPNQNHLS